MSLDGVSALLEFVSAPINTTDNSFGWSQPKINGFRRSRNLACSCTFLFSLRLIQSDLYFGQHETYLPLSEQLLGTSQPMLPCVPSIGKKELNRTVTEFRLVLSFESLYPLTAYALNAAGIL